MKGMKFISVDVSKLATHDEKRMVFDSFRELGWLKFPHFIVPGESYPALDVKKWGLCWDADEVTPKGQEPQYPEIPSICTITDFDENSSNE